MNRFFAYEEYGAKYELMIKDIAIIHRAMPEWDKYQKGLEALAASLCSTNNSEDPSRRALTVGDLLVKVCRASVPGGREQLTLVQPIQRMCKYPLLFAELLKHTPVCDCPYSYMEIESALIRLREATGAINRATDDERTKATLEKTWLLQDRLVFPDQVRNPVLPCVGTRRPADDRPSDSTRPLEAAFGRLAMSSSAASFTSAGKPRMASRAATWCACCIANASASRRPASRTKPTRSKPVLH